MSHYFSAIALLALALSSIPAKAKTFPHSSTCVDTAIISGKTITFTSTLNRARNLARQAAEKVNGGLSNYRAEASMYGPTAEAPCVDNGHGTWTFTFTGSRPGSTIPTVESVVNVAKDRPKVTIDYNGPINLQR